MPDKAEDKEQSLCWNYRQLPSLSDTTSDLADIIASAHFSTQWTCYTVLYTGLSAMGWEFSVELVDSVCFV